MIMTTGFFTFQTVFYHNVDCSAAVHMCSFRTLSCGNIVHEQILSEQRIKKEKPKAFLFLRCEHSLAKG